MTQQEIDDAEWHNPANWHGGMAGIYYSRRDSRSFVPKRVTWAGVTINFARPAGIVFLLCILALGIIPVVLTRGARHG